MDVVKSIHELIGKTPLLELTSFPLPNNVRLVAKLEYLNPGGSVKDRLGQTLLKEAVQSGQLKKGGTIIEPTAGNTGIGLALAAIGQGYQVMFVVPEKFSVEKQTLMKALGAEIVHTPTELGMKGAIAKANELFRTIPNAYSPRQFENPANPKAYYETLGPEIWEQTEGAVTHFIAGAGTGGTFMGTTEFLKAQNPDIKATIVEPEGSILNGGPEHPHKTEGIGMEFLPGYMKPEMFDSIRTISDEDAFKRVKELARLEGCLVGSSSGAALHAALLEAEKALPGSLLVTIFPDGSERYLSKKIYEGGI
ncbi:MAG TPA: cysteine synthase family protein [Sporolactobacillaceae bacterium]|nr:cysteine synthase family protein [Sporolactobacillaceae bacterium]